jgi:peptidoglycan hydrolase CwlO-like protein
MDDMVQVKVDVGVLKNQVDVLTRFIEKLMSNQDKLVEQIYNDMEKKKADTNVDIKELHSRITTVDRSLSDKLELTERRIMDEIKSLRVQISEHNKKEDDELKKISEWKWMVGGGILLLSFLLSLVKIDILKLFGM